MLTLRRIGRAMLSSLVAASPDCNDEFSAFLPLKQRRQSRQKRSAGGMSAQDGGKSGSLDIDTPTTDSSGRACHMGFLSSTPLTPATFNVVTINVSGLRYQTFAETLERYPHSLLGSPAKRSQYYNGATNEYFFDRHRTCFDAILYYYQSNGRLKRPENIPVDIFVRELRFYELGDDVVEKFWISEGYRKPKEIILPKNKLQRQIYQIMEHPDTSMCARVVAFLSVFVIVLSTASFCLETLPDFQERFDHEPHTVLVNLSNGTQVETVEQLSKWQDPFFIIETICIVWFTFEFVLRFASCPSKVKFCKSFLNWVDFVAIVPFFVNLAMSENGGGGSSSAMSFAVLRVLRLVRVFRIFKLSRHSRGLQILGKTFKASVQELCLLVFFMCIGLVLFSSAVYFAETGVVGSKFKSIPEAFWYAIVTMTTVGYGDLTPVGPWGKLVGSMCAIVGVLVLALPVPVIVANFKHFYRQETRLAHMASIDAADNGDCDADSVSS